MAKKRTAPKPKPKLSCIAEELRPLAVPIGELTPDPQNARRHDEANIAAIAASLDRFGQLKPIVIHVETGVVEAGNGMVEAARRLGWSHLAAVQVAHDPATATGFAVADNRTAELAAWDDAMLAEAIAEIQQQTPDLADALLLADLVEQQAEAEAKVGGGESAAPGQEEPGQEEPESWQVVVDCGDEDGQRKLFERLDKEGFNCRLLTL